MGAHKIYYDKSRKLFYVRINSGQRYEKRTVEELTRELTKMGIEWKLSRDAKKQIKAFKLKDQ